MRLNLTATDIALGLIVALVWGMGIVFAKAAIGHFPPILLMSLRFAVTAGVLVWVVRPPMTHMRALFAISFISATVQYSLTFTGLKGLDASVTALVVQLEVPFLVIIGAVALNERPGWRKWVGIIMAFCGVAFLAGAPRVAVAWGSVALVIGGAFTWAVGQAMVRALRDIDGLTITAWVAVFAAPQLLIVSLIFETGHVAALQSAGWLVWSAVIYLGLIMTALGYGIWYSLLRRNPVSQVAPFLLMLPVFSVLGGVLVLGETLGPYTLLGGAIILAGVGFIVIEPAAARQ